MNESLLPLAAAAPVAAAYAYLRVRQPSPALRSLARPRDLAALTPRGALTSAKRLRRLDTGKPPLTECGVLLGQLQPRGPRLYSSFEETILAVMGPRAGHKTTGLAIPTVLHAPGPVIATSNKPDLWMATAALRADRRRRTAPHGKRRDAAAPTTGPAPGPQSEVWTFDPQQIAHADQTWWWDPLAGLTDVEAAHRLATMFVTTVDGDGTDTFWTKSARQLLTTLFAAAHHGREPISTVWRWLNEPASVDPGELLRAHHETELAQSFEGINGQHPRTRDSVYITAQVAADCLANRQITAWVTPNPALPRFRPAAFVGSHDTLHLLSKDGGGSAGPLVAALTDVVLRAAVHAAERAGGRLDPPLVAVLDEAANVCRIADLPLLYSHFGSRGVIPLTILQSYSQGTQAWGQAGMKTLWTAANIKLVGAGADDATFVGDISRLVGDHDVPTVSRGSGRGGHTRTHATRREAILSPADIRSIRKGEALLLAAGCKPALLRLQPWYRSKHRDAIAAAIDTAQRGITERTVA